MLQQILIGNIGADAKKQMSGDRKFTTFRVAHNESWTDQSGQQHSSTVWVDCILNDHPKVADYLKQGQTVAVIGDVSLRVYSSEKDRCMKAGMTIRVRHIELLGGASDAVPSRLYDTSGVQHDVHKAYYSDVKSMQLQSLRGQWFDVDENGWITPLADNNADNNNNPDDTQKA